LPLRLINKDVNLTTVNAMPALADPVRVQIVELLAGREMSAGEIAARFEISAPAISRHLRVLRTAGLTTVRIQAQHRIYRLNPEPFAELGAWALMQHRMAAARLDALATHLNRMKSREERKERRRGRTRSR
jgi:DNA-binding transcriptional ArsR family regulator